MKIQNQWKSSSQISLLKWPSPFYLYSKPHSHLKTYSLILLQTPANNPTPSNPSSQLWMNFPPKCFKQSKNYSPSHTSRYSSNPQSITLPPQFSNPRIMISRPLEPIIRIGTRSHQVVTRNSFWWRDIFLTGGCGRLTLMRITHSMYIPVLKLSLTNSSLPQKTCSLMICVSLASMNTSFTLSRRNGIYSRRSLRMFPRWLEVTMWSVHLLFRFKGHQS